MDMTESYRQPAPDIISKSDFFDFVTSNELTDAQYKQQMRSVNVFMESPDSHSNPLLSDEPKEQNNNSLLSVVGAVSSTEANMTTATTTLQSFDSIWNVDRERDRLETAMLEDLNKFYWSQDGDINTSAPMETQNPNNKLISNNTDGQIYTLTVLNHESAESTGTNRYWGKEEEVSLSSPIEMEQIQQSSLDLESILDIMPSQMNGFPNDFNQDALTNPSLEKVDSFAEYDDHNHDGHTSNISESDQIIKVEDFSYDESEFNQVEVKEETLSGQMIIDTPLLEAQVEFNNNNNDWKLVNQNNESNESLLRSALQGKAFIRYSNAAQKIITNKIESSGEIKRVIINNNNNKMDMPSMYREAKDMPSEHAGANQLVMTLAPSNGVNIVLFEDHCENVLPEAENPTTTQCVDDILLSQLDASYPEDFEKLKRIANEVAESVQQFCVEQVDPSRNIYNIHHLNGAELVTMIPTQGDQHQTHLQIVTSPAVTSTKCASKKSRSGSKNKSSTIQANQSHIVCGSSSSSIQTATSTSNGIRKERSLHYCSICSKGFKDKYSVNVHVRTHTGEKPFSCSLCGKSFRQKAHLAKHYQTHIAQKNAAANGTVKTTKQR